jgi:hypothetical protein
MDKQKAPELDKPKPLEGSHPYNEAGAVHEEPRKEPVRKARAAGSPPQDVMDGLTKLQECADATAAAKSKSEGSRTDLATAQHTCDNDAADFTAKAAQQQAAKEALKALLDNVYSVQT